MRTDDLSNVKTAVAPLVPFETYTPVRVIECGKIERFLHPNFYTQNQYFVVAKGWFCNKRGTVKDPTGCFWLISRLGHVLILDPGGYPVYEFCTVATWRKFLLEPAPFLHFACFLVVVRWLARVKSREMQIPLWQCNFYPNINQVASSVCGGSHEPYHLTTPQPSIFNVIETPA